MNKAKESHWNRLTHFSSIRMEHGLDIPALYVDRGHIVRGLAQTHLISGTGQGQMIS